MSKERRVLNWQYLKAIKTDNSLDHSLKKVYLRKTKKCGHEVVKNGKNLLY